MKPPDKTDKSDLTLEQLRSQLTNKGLVLFSFVVVPALIVSLFRARLHGWQPVFTLHIISAVVIVFAAFFRNRLPYGLRAGIIILLWSAIGVVGVLNFGLISAGIPVLICMMFATTILFGLKPGLAATAAYAIFMATMGALVSSGAYDYHLDFNVANKSYLQWFLATFVFVFWGPAAVFGVGSVIGHLHNSLALLRQSRQEYQEIFNGVTDAIFIHDSDTGEVVDVNQQMLDMYRCTRQDVIGKNVLRFSINSSPYDSHHIKNHLNNAKITNGPVSFDWHAQKLDGTLFWVNVTLKPLAVGGKARILAVVRDVTEQRQANEMLIQSEKMASVGGLAAGMAHEINNPLGGILHNAQVLSNRLLENISPNQTAATETGVPLGKIQEYMQRRDIPRILDNLRNSGDRASGIVLDMLNFARKSDAEDTICDLSSLVEQTLNIAGTDYNLKKKYDFKKIHIIRDYNPSVPQILCSPGKIQQVIFNIIRNGAEAMSEFRDQMADREPTFTIRLDSSDNTNFVRLTIADNGPGMPEAIRKRVFEPFFTTKNVGHGTGLGLSVSYFIVAHDHGGEIKVTSREGKGTSFEILLPLKNRDVHWEPPAPRK